MVPCPKAGAASKQRQSRQCCKKVSAQLMLTRTVLPLGRAVGAGEGERAGVAPLSLGSVSALTAGPAPGQPRIHGSLSSGTSLVQPEGNVTTRLPANTLKHHSTPLQQSWIFFFSWPSAHMYIIIFYSGLSIPPLPPQENKPESTECASQRPRRWRPVGKGHAVVTAARPPQPAVLVDIGSTVYFSKEPSLCIRCIAATGFVFKA